MADVKETDVSSLFTVVDGTMATDVVVSDGRSSTLDDMADVELNDDITTLVVEDTMGEVRVEVESVKMSTEV